MMTVYDRQLEKSFKVSDKQRQLFVDSSPIRIRKKKEKKEKKIRWRDKMQSSVCHQPPRPFFTAWPFCWLKKKQSTKSWGYSGARLSAPSIVRQQRRRRRPYTSLYRESLLLLLIFFLTESLLTATRIAPKKGRSQRPPFFKSVMQILSNSFKKKRIGWTHQKIKMKILLTESESVQWINGRKKKMNAANKSRLVQYLQTLIKFIAVSDCPRRFR